jgi:hypothetical protein
LVNDAFMVMFLTDFSIVPMRKPSPYFTFTSAEFFKAVYADANENLHVGINLFTLPAFTLP